MKPIQVNITSKATTIKRVQHNGRDHWMVSSYTLPADCIMNGGLYPKAEIEAHYQSLDGTLAPFGHPMVDGHYVSAFSPEGINVGHVGAWNTNVRLDGNRVAVDKMIDVEVAGRTENGKRLLERLEQIEAGQAEPISTSVAVFLNQKPAPKGAPYQWIAEIEAIDHDAILMDEEPAASVEQGVGIMVNTADAVPMADIKPHVTVAQRLKQFFNPQARPALFANQGESMPPEEKAELAKVIGETVATNTAEAVSEAVKPLQAQITALQENQKSLSEQVTANARAEEAEKRKVVADKHGDIVANALSGEALDAMYKALGTAEPVGNGADPSGEPAVPSFDNYFTE